MGQRSNGTWAVLAGGVTLLCVGGAHAITDSAFVYSSPQTGYLALPHSAFSSEGHTSNFRNDHLDGATSASGVACAGTGINLPQGAVITNVVIWAESTSAGLPTFEILRRRASNNAVVPVASGTFQDTSGVRVSMSVPVTAATATINNGAYAYSARICVNTTSAFYQARVTYTFTNAGD